MIREENVKGKIITPTGGEIPATGWVTTGDADIPAQEFVWPLESPPSIKCSGALDITPEAWNDLFNRIIEDSQTQVTIVLDENGKKRMAWLRRAYTRLKARYEQAMSKKQRERRRARAVFRRRKRGLA